MCTFTAKFWLFKAFAYSRSIKVCIKSNFSKSGARFILVYPRIRISPRIPFFLSCMPSSIVATANALIPILLRIVDILQAPCPYACAFTTAINSHLDGIASVNIFTLCFRFSIFSSIHERSVFACILPTLSFSFYHTHRL